MKHFKIVLSLFIALLILAACNNEEKRDEPLSKHGSITHKKSNFPDFKIATYKSHDTPHIEIQYPVFKSDEINNKFIALRDHDINEFTQMLDDDTDNHILNITIDPQVVNDHAYLFHSVKKSKVNSEDAFFRHRFTMVNKDTENVSFSDTLFGTDTDKRTELFEILNDKVMANGALAPYYHKEKLEKIILNKNHLFKNVEFKDNIVEFHFNSEEIGLPAMGTPTISVNLKDVIHLLDSKLNETILSDEDMDQVVEEEVVEEEETDEVYVERELSSDDKMIALTFDDGPRAGTTDRLLDTLDEYDSKATFFMLGHSINNYPEIATEVDERGHEIGNHSYTHRDMLSLSIDEVLKEINDTTLLIEKFTNQTPEFFRPPYGSFNQEYAANIPLGTAFWSIDTEDWLTHNPDAILHEIQTHAHDGAVILMHDIHAETVDAIPRVLEYLKNEGYECVTVSELSKYKGRETTEMR